MTGNNMNKNNTKQTKTAIYYQIKCEGETSVANYLQLKRIKKAFKTLKIKSCSLGFCPENYYWITYYFTYLNGHNKPIHSPQHILPSFLL